MTQVLIVGAGPAGLVMAIELMKRGVEIRIVDELAAPTDQSRALGIQPRSLEIFERMGVIEPMLINGLPIEHGYFHKDGKTLLDIDFPSLASPYPFLLVLPQSETEIILTQHLESIGGKVEREVSFTGFTGNNTILRHRDGKEEYFNTQWIMGCDGAHSGVRHALNIPFKGAKLREGFLLADVKMSSDFDHKSVNIFFSSQGFFGVIPLPEENAFRLIADGAPEMIEENSCMAFLEKLASIRAPGFTIQIQKTTWMSYFSIHRRMVKQMRHGNVFLVGDAAHIHSPAGGQGLNTSIQDAYNLAWKLALVIQGQATESLLDSYQAERSPVAKRVLRGTTIATKLVTSKNPVVRMLFLYLLPRLLQKRSLCLKIVNAVAELSMNYRKSPIVAELQPDKKWKGPKPGDRAPDASLGSTGERLFLVLQKTSPLQHTLLVFVNQESSTFLSQIRMKWKGLIQIVPVTDTQGDLAKIYHADQPCYYLIRPDGYIGSRSRSLDEKSFTRYLEKIFQNSSS